MDLKDGAGAGGKAWKVTIERYDGAVSYIVPGAGSMRSKIERGEGTECRGKIFSSSI